MTLKDDALRGLADASTAIAEMDQALGDADQNSIIQLATIASLKAELEACRNPTPPGPKVRYETGNFQLDRSNSLFGVLGGGSGGASKANTFVYEDHLELRCDNGLGAEVFFPARFATGYWEVECYFKPPLSVANLGGTKPSTKVCLLLWTEGSWSQNHHEIDFNESALRTESHQSMHYENTAGTHQIKHSAYAVNQYEKHTYGVRVSATDVKYYLDGVLKSTQGGVPQDNWNLHIRSIPKGSTDKTTLVVTKVRCTE